MSTAANAPLDLVGTMSVGSTGVGGVPILPALGVAEVLLRAAYSRREEQYLAIGCGSS